MCVWIIFKEKYTILQSHGWMWWKLFLQPILWNYINNIHLLYIYLISPVQESFSSMKYLPLVTLFHGALLPLPVNLSHLYVKTRLPCCILFGMQTSKGSRNSSFWNMQMPLNLAFSIRHPDQSSPVPGKRLTGNGSIFNVFPKYFGPEWRAGFNIRDCQGRQWARQADMTRNHSSGDRACSLPLPACLSGSLFSQKRRFQSRKIFSLLWPETPPKVWDIKQQGVDDRLRALWVLVSLKAGILICIQLTKRLDLLLNQHLR